MDTCKLTHVRTISVQNNKVKSDLSISLMHMGNSYLGLQQQIASCNAISIKALAPSVDTVFPLTQQTEECQVQKTKAEERLSGATHTQMQLITSLLIVIVSDCTHLQTEKVDFSPFTSLY